MSNENASVPTGIMDFLQGMEDRFSQRLGDSLRGIQGRIDQLESDRAVPGATYREPVSASATETAQEGTARGYPLLRLNEVSHLNPAYPELFISQFKNLVPTFGEPQVHQIMLRSFATNPEATVSLWYSAMLLSTEDSVVVMRGTFLGWILLIR